jgi:hypothetical protein
MLTGMNTTPEILSKLEQSPFNFTLTGSRFFGGENDNSDYDFFVQKHENKQLTDFLTSLGFTQTYRRYSDSVTMSNWVWNRKGQTQIHVQIVRDANLKRQAQTILAKSVNMRMITDKAIRAYIWNAVIMALQQGKYNVNRQN